MVGGTGGPISTGQDLGLLVLADTIIANTLNGTIISLYTENSTSLLLQNIVFFNIKTAITDSVKNQVILAGRDKVLKDSWGFSMINNATGNGSFVSGQDIPAMNYIEAILGIQAYIKPNLFMYWRPQYENLKPVILNYILTYTANLSSVVYFPFGVYKIQDILNIPLGLHIIGQAWSQIIATGNKFSDVNNPHVAVKVGVPSNVGIIKIRDMLFTVSGPTAGVILVE
ncbi:hypothetical protein ETB97_011180 [Aspergillus alliaceus]|uniref:Uncharacterized protein n=1 Tax=Petromyces alliaceus TaxID=209559 RepID=A0A8H6A4P9_PETAA|nr:hypothetical protein ETB97_011180 [Aspergillus burnettii]